MAQPDDIAEAPLVKRVVVVGGGTAGWMSATGIVSLLGEAVDVTLVESEAIGTVGVGEATLPHLRYFNHTIGLDERDMMRATKATVKLGIEFVDWGRIGDSYIHPFGDFGMRSDGVPFHNAWAAAGEPGRIFDYSLPCVAARMGRFEEPSDDPRSVKSTYRWAYQFDATLYAPYLRRVAERRGCTRVEGKVVEVLHHEDGDIRAVRLEGGREVEGDLFVDCTGFRALLMEGALEAGYETWTDWLPCDRAVAVPCTHEGELLPYTRATAKAAGWQWRIPLQHRAGNGYVYSSAHISDDAAMDTLMSSIEGAPIAEPKQLRFTTGKRRSLWKRNCVAIGLSGGFLEPLESTSIHLIQKGITYLIELFPELRNSPVREREYNRLMDREFERVRDFLILHYTATERDDTGFWDDMRNLDVPDSLAEKMALFRDRGLVQTYDHGLFLEASWVAVYLGQRVRPENPDPRVANLPKDAIARMEGLRRHIGQAARAMPTHAEWIARNCAAEQVAAA